MTIPSRLFSMIYSIGYHKKSLTIIDRLMRAKNISILIDVRSRPYSKFNQDFNQDCLQRELTDRYSWQGDKLGGFQSNRISDEDLNRLIQLAHRCNIMLMCMESNPRQCHRYHKIAKNLLPKNIDMTHIIDQDEILTSILVQEEKRQAKQLRLF